MIQLIHIGLALTYLAPVTIPAIHLVTHDTPHSYCTTLGTSGTRCGIVETSRTRYPVYIPIPMIHLTYIVLPWTYLVPVTIPAIHLVHTTRYRGHTLQLMTNIPTLCNPDTSRTCYTRIHIATLDTPRALATLDTPVPMWLPPDTSNADHQTIQIRYAIL